MARSVRELLLDLVQLYQYNEVSVTLDASADGPIPGDSDDVVWVFPDKEIKGFLVKATGAANIKIQVKAAASDTTWYTLNKKEADGVITWAMIANEGMYIFTDAPGRYFRLWATDTSTAENTITATAVAK